ncbi:MAG: glycoside hydrolase family 127 protein [Christensenellales bacterium]|jgi:DUF1680 family protein
MAKSSFVPFDSTDITGGFWKKRQDIVAEVSIHSIYDRFTDTHRFDFFENDWDSSKEYSPHIFWDSDVAKWMESAAYILEKRGSPELLEVCERIVDAIERYQGEDGYFNSFFQKVDPQMRFKDRSAHELYCAGHLMEAAVAYYNATGKDRMLRAMEKYAAYIDRIFVKENLASYRTPGHEEIELALVKLYRATGNEKYLRMSGYFVDERGRGIETDNGIHMKAEYNQSHQPVREQKTAEGHSVRAVYLYSAMADLAYELEDETLVKACDSLIESIAEKRMYVTGGIGSTREGEAFTVDYDLPNISAYAESCAALGLALFCRRMSLIRPKSFYADIAEICIYNGFLSSISLDGRAFFYENPLEIHPYMATRHKSIKKPPKMPDMQRKEVFTCSCCPPNITRFIASIADFLYTTQPGTLFVHHYMHSESDIKGVKVSQKTDYPATGAVKISAGEGFDNIAVRIPGWCESYSIRLNGKEERHDVIDGYAFVPAKGGAEIELSFEMKPFAQECNPNVLNNAGKVAVQRGPVVYCLEAVDNGENLCDIRLLPDKGFGEEASDYGVPTIAAAGVRRDEKSFNGLYRRYQPGDRNDCGLRFIPYFAFANRGISEMIVWVKV